MTGTIAVVMTFSIPIIAILTFHTQRLAKIKHNMIKDEITLEKLKQENFLLETEKMKLELEQMKIEGPKDHTKII
ncbi:MULTISPECIES: hypothetical protein [Cytobacillus]|uniref:Uncharacterized protein n=3 Tax=Cytobacillus TaxID=2675230 RepID=A0A160M8I9_9BACI|nr:MULTISPECIES: hypothetical protein [Cytobacillus]EFV74857.1 hypothetical protein HMPREF1013_04883 [Bacillus sp. 2_A_57_CT2]MBY0155908.1 hypothetical protein [Cytobacillus firmus]AND38664.1 hypothetical protein A361_05840 [Cytobacillus oceanisediminis 2691]MBU8729943.1 hypothetical protein [Cytobacillus oceanisediminis]MBU8770797.1 hypothetical protein [Cytobacillus oceanisediminis]